MRSRILFGVIVAASLSSAADAHFVLVQPAASLMMNRLGDPQKIGPCGGVSANPGRGTPANPGVPSGAVTNVKGGTELPLLVHESIFHPGHYRVALARTARTASPKDPEVTVTQTEKGPRSQSAVIQNPELVSPPGAASTRHLRSHRNGPTQQHSRVSFRSRTINCPSCVLQVIELHGPRLQHLAGIAV